MNAVDLINRKRRGEVLEAAAIDFLVQGYTAGDIPDYQLSAFLMAVCLQGMTAEETAALTFAMRDSGEIMDLSAIPGIKVDKHSTGGVGDKTTLALIPIAAACGVPCAKLSGRGLGFTGGTLDKLECFPGFRTDLSEEAFVRQVHDIGAAVSGQTKDLTPADRKMYALRDVTGTVESIPLIASSIMSKKLASGADRIVLDVKTGSGAFMKSLSDSIALAEEMKALGEAAGHKVSCFVTDMDQPLGNAVGNVHEVLEAIATLKGEGPADFTELTMALAEEMLLLSGVCSGRDEAAEKIREAVRTGAALEKLCEIVERQGSDRKYVLHPDLLETSAHSEEVLSDADGCISGINAELIGRAETALGGGRTKKDDVIDLTTGMVFHRKVGDRIDRGDSLLTLYYNDAAKKEEALKLIRQAVSIGQEVPEKGPVILRRPADIT